MNMDQWLIRKALHPRRDPYIIVEAGSTDGLKLEVNDAIGDGYKPVGSMSVSTGRDGYPVYAQPMLRE